MSRARIAWSNVLIGCLLVASVAGGWHAWHIDREVRLMALRGKTLTEWLDGAKSACIVTDDRGFVLEWNPSATELLGWPREEMIGVNIVTLMPPTNARHHSDEYFGREWSDLNTLIVSCWLVKKDGSSIEVQVAIRASVKGSMRLFGVLIDRVGAVRQITNGDRPDDGPTQLRRVDPAIRKERLP